jgi:Zn-dependent peptidase ImmA (M78 family)/transcriptional regulator with XRE-family HTH domain
MIYGERVKQVRELQHLTQSALAAMIPELTQSQLSRIESEATIPPPETLAIIAGSLGVTVDFFERRPSHDFEALSPQLRARSSRLTQGVKASAMQWARLVLEEYERLQLRGSVIPVKLTRLPGIPPRDAAGTVRALLGFGSDTPLPYLVLAIERMGVLMLGLPYSAAALDAFCAWRGTNPVIAVLTGVPGDRLRWSVAHELGHLVMHERGERGKDVEAQADEFAAELLTPSTAIANAMPTAITLNSLTMLKTQWGVSIKSLIRRARELDFVDQDRAISLYKQVSARGWNKSEPGYVPREKPRAFRKLAEISYGQGPNIERMALDAAWSQELTMQVLDEHATTEELPMEPQPASTSTAGGNVVPFRRPGRNSAPADARNAFRRV